MSKALYEIAFERLPERFRKPNNLDLYYVLYGYGYDEMHEALDGVKDSRDISKASGKSLDYLGANVGQLRQGEDDERYRLLIKTRIIANLSMGDIPTINHILSTLIDDKYFGLVEGFKEIREPASFLIDYDGFTNQDLDVLIGRIKAAGVAYKTRRVYETDVKFASASISGEHIVISQPALDDLIIDRPFIVRATNSGTYEHIEIKNEEFI